MSGLLMTGFSVPILGNNFIMYYQHIQFALEEEQLKRKIHHGNGHELHVLKI
jgi:hypothetical protein